MPYRRIPSPGETTALLRQAVAESGLSQRRISVLMDVSEKHVNAMLNGKTSVSALHAVLLAEVLNLTAEGILITQIQEELRDIYHMRNPPPPEEPEAEPTCQEGTDLKGRPCLRAPGHTGRHKYQLVLETAPKAPRKAAPKPAPEAVAVEEPAMCGKGRDLQGRPCLKPPGHAGRHKYQLVWGEK